MKCEVSIDDVELVDKKYAVYFINVKVIRAPNDVTEYRSRKRFNDFVQLKKHLEAEFCTDLPYELPGRKFSWVSRGNSCDPDVIEERRSKLRVFLSDLLNDSFDTRWRSSPIVAHFLNMPSVWDKVPSNAQKRDYAGITAGGSIDTDCRDPAKWLDILRDCKTDMSSNNIKQIMKHRLTLAKLEKGLQYIEANQLVSKIECERRKLLVNTLKKDLNDVQKLPASYSDDPKALPFPPDNYPRREDPKIIGGRKLGESHDTKGLSNHQLLQLDKSCVQDQDEQLHSLHQIVQRQKEISLALNQELEAQNEMLDMFQEEAHQSANKLRMANRNAVRFNQGQR